MTFADRMIEDLGPSFSALAGPLLSPLLEALTGPINDAAELLQTTTSGWATFADLDSTPQPWWFGQVVGVQVDRNLTTDQQREVIRSRPNARRGTPAAMVAAVQTLLTGQQRVHLSERVGGDAYALNVTVYSPDLIDPATTTAEVLAVAATQKPVGVLLTVTISPGATYADIESYGTYAAAAAAVSDYSDLDSTIP